jgi:hypothetical protein
MGSVSKKRAAVKRFTRLDLVFGQLVLTIKVGDEVFLYDLVEIPTELGGRAFRLRKAGVEPEEYNVLLNGEHSTCDCRGFARYGMGCHGGTGCKHVGSLNALVAAGRLPRKEVAS